MPITRPCYCTREDVLSATDIRLTSDYARHIDSAIEQASDDVDNLCHRRFYPVDATRYWDWPNFQRAYPWRIWFDQAELADVTVNVPVVKTGTAGGSLTGTVIPNTAVFWGHPNYSPPYTYLELDRSQSYAFGTGPTPQRDVSIAGTFGYDLVQEPVGSLAGNLGNSSSATASITWTTARIGVGDLLTIDSERMLVTDRTFTDTSQTLQTALAADNSVTTVAVGNGSAYGAEDILQLDSEQMFVESVTGNNLTVIRAWNGTVLASHSGTEIYALRGVQLTRAVCGTAIASHTTGATISRKVYPGTVHELALAEALNTVFQKTSGYARTIGENQTLVPGGSLPDLRKRVFAGFGRKVRSRVIL